MKLPKIEKYLKEGWDGKACHLFVRVHKGVWCAGIKLNSPPSEDPRKLEVRLLAGGERAHVSQAVCSLDICLGSDLFEAQVWPTDTLLTKCISTIDLEIRVEIIGDDNCFKAYVVSLDSNCVRDTKIYTYSFVDLGVWAAIDDLILRIGERIVVAHRNGGLCVVQGGTSRP